MIFKEKTIIKYLEKKHSVVISSIYQIDNKNRSDDVNINCDCNISFFVDVCSTPGYERFNLKIMLNVIQLDFSDLLKYIRKKKLDEIS